MKRAIALFAILTMTAACLAGCAAGAEKTGGGKIKIVVTDFPCYDFARATAGDMAEITMLIKPGAEVHTFEPTPGDVVSMMDSDLFIYIGGESDAWVGGMLASMDGAPNALKLFDCVEARQEETVEGMETGEEPEDGETEYDEHIWTSPKNAMLMVRAIADALSEADPANAGAYAENADGYIGEISALDSEIRELVNGAARRELIFGDRFPFLYLAKEYALTYSAAFPGCAAETEPSAQTLMFLINKVKNDGVPVIYEIEMSTGNVARTIAEETGAEVMTLHSMQNVTGDEFSAGETYVSIMKKNIEALRKGLN